MPDETKQPTTGGQIEPIKTGGVFDWLANTFGIQQVRAAAASWLNLKVNVNITLPDGTPRNTTARPVIAENNSVLTIPVDLSQSGLQQSASAAEAMFPFKIYACAHATDSSLDARTFQIRGGLIGIRPNYPFPGLNTTQAAVFFQGNYEFPLLAGGTDFTGSAWDYATSKNDFTAAATVNTGGTVTLAMSGAQLICSNAPGAMPAGGVQIVLPVGQDRASLWLKIIQSQTDGPYVELWGGYGDGAGTSGLPFKRGYTGTNLPYQEVTLALGYVIGTASQITFSQAQTSHLLNRYLELMPRPTAETETDSRPKFEGIPQVHRGYWTRDSLSGTIIYPGDIVVDDSHNFSNVAIGNYYLIYVYIFRAPQTVTLSPFNSGTNWQKYGIYPR